MPDANQSLSSYAVADRNPDKALLDVVIFPESAAGTSLSSHMGYVHVLGSEAASKFGPSKGDIANDGTSPSGPSGDLADARCELRSGLSGLCARPITPSESGQLSSRMPSREECGRPGNVQPAACTSLTKRQEATAA